VKSPISFFNELKRRNVVRMGMLYVVASWMVLQIADVMFEPLGVPAWVLPLFMSLLAVGFPFALVFSWVFELTPEGIKRESEIDRSESIVHTTSHRMNVVIVLLLVVAIGGLVADRLIPRNDVQDAASPQRASTIQAEATSDSVQQAVTDTDTSIAVLPFVNMSGDKDNEYFSDGLTEELLNSLVRLGGLKVTGRTSSFAFKDQNQDLREIGQLLNVANVLEGSVRKAGNRVRITAQLVKTSDGYHLWSETFDRELDDIFSIQAEIAEQVSRALQVTLLGQDEADEPAVTLASHNAKAYEEYLRGLYVLQHEPDSKPGVEKARNHFEKALAIDPEYIEAYEGMFNVWDRINRNGFVPFTESIGQMASYLGKMQSLAPTSEQALAAAARLAMVRYDYEQAAEYIEDAASRYPGSATVQATYAGINMLLRSKYMVDGATEKAEQARENAVNAIREARALDPLSLANLRNQGNIFYSDGDCAGLERLLERALELDPDAGRLRGLLAACIYTNGGDKQLALSHAEKEPLDFFRHTLTAIILDSLGDRSTAQQHVDEMTLAYGDSASYQYGQVYAQWGEPDKAMTWLETALEIHDPGIITSGGDPLLDPLRDEPRFKEILKAAGYD
jgi:serine/threonine-protein kinase